MMYSPVWEFERARTRRGRGGAAAASDLPRNDAVWARGGQGVLADAGGPLDPSLRFDWLDVIYDMAFDEILDDPRLASAARSECTRSTRNA